MDSFGIRLKKAREHAKLNQSELARLVPPLKAQAIQHLENPKKKAQGSKATVALARACGVNPDWLATGKGDMLTTPHAMKEPESAAYGKVNQEALQIAIAWARLSPDRQQLFREMIFLQAALEARHPWMRRGRPKGETYEQWEKRQEQNFEAMVTLAAARVAHKH
jgi:transcriptional regulator with XRE-family HTH domain